jgi:hypothetical protein
MSVTSQARSILYPMFHPASNDVITLDAASEMCANIVQAPVSGDITTVLWRTGTIGAGTFTLKVGIQGVNAATGNPEGVYLASTTISSSIIFSGTIYETLLDAPLTVSRGQMLAVVFEITAYTSGSIQISNIWQGGDSIWSVWQRPYTFKFLGGVPSKSNNPIQIGLKIGSTYHSCGGFLPAFRGGNAFKSDSAQDEIGNAITLPWGANCEGVWVRTANTADDFDIVLYDAAGDVLRTITVDKDQLAGTTGGVYLFDSTAALVAGQLYRVVLKPRTTTANNAGMYYHTFLNATVFASLPGGASIYGTARADGGAWTDYNNVTNGFIRQCIGFVLDGIDIPAAGGGGGPLVGAGGLVG